MTPVLIWQTTQSPHMTPLAGALAEQGVWVGYAAQADQTSDRIALGWQGGLPDGVEPFTVTSRETAAKVLESAPEGTVHVVQGIRGNPVCEYFRSAAANAGRPIRWMALMEQIDLRPPRGLLKRLLYRRRFAELGDRLEAILAIGARAPAQMRAFGVAPDKVVPFAYFMSDRILHVPRQQRPTSAPFRVGYVGQLIALKDVSTLIRALGQLGRNDVELIVVGSGPLAARLRSEAERFLPGVCHWCGVLPMEEAIATMATFDCLVLPSRYDGWGAVSSEALMAGVPAIVSDACGTSAAVTASGHGGVFRAGDVKDLADVLRTAVERGRLSDSEVQRLRTFASWLGASAGAQYLTRILHQAGCGGTQTILPPWEIC